jgi:putative transposase
MREPDRLGDVIDWIDLSFVERDWTPRWAIKMGTRYHLSGMSLRATSQFLGELWVDCSHAAIHNWVHEARLQLISTLSAHQLAVDEKVIRFRGEDS